MKRFAYGIMAGFLAVFGGLAMLYFAAAEFWPARLPPPAISPLVHLDEKLRFLRQHPDLDPQVLAVGSSVTWRQLDGSAFDRRGGKTLHFLNGATAQLQVHQTRELVELYLGHFPNVRVVIVMLGLPDFSDCTREQATLMDRDDAAAYAFGRWPEAYFYLRYFSPQRYLSTALHLIERKRPFVGDLFLDRYGSGPVALPDSVKLGLRYSAITPDPACVDAVIGLSRYTTDRGVRLVIVFPPVHPEYREKYPDATAALRSIAGRVAGAVARDTTKVLNLIDDPGFGATDFYDAFHLQWPSAGRLSAKIAGSIDTSIAVDSVKAEPAQQKNASGAKL